MRFLETEHRSVFDKLLVDFPQWSSRKWQEGGAWLDDDRMGVDPEWSSWLTDAIEATDLVIWCDGEPWTCDCDTPDAEWCRLHNNDESTVA